MKKLTRSILDFPSFVSRACGRLSPLLRVLAACLAVTFILSAKMVVARTCPKLLMFDGVNIRTELNPAQARYWGKTVGIQGFFLNNIMADWQQDVGDSPYDGVWKQAREFQKLYSEYGVQDNFIKVAIWKRHNWRDMQANHAVVTNFFQAAELARYAGFQGIALDLEPYVPIWGGGANPMSLSSLVYRVGHSIGTAMRKAYPSMTLVLMQDAFHYAQLHEGYHGGYGLAVPFLKGLLSAHFARVIFATERSYRTPPWKMPQLLANEKEEDSRILKNEMVGSSQTSVAPGIWPLGFSYQNKNARMSPRQFLQALRADYASNPEFVWIYGFGSAWQTNGPYGKGPVVGDFSAYTNAIHEMEKSCSSQTPGL
jgi:hypothetical protein